MSYVWQPSGYAGRVSPKRAALPHVITRQAPGLAPPARCTKRDPARYTPSNSSSRGAGPHSACRSHFLDLARTRAPRLHAYNQERAEA